MDRDIIALSKLTEKDCTKEDVRKAVAKPSGRVPFVLGALMEMMLDFFDNTKNPRDPKYLTFVQFFNYAKKNGLDFLTKQGLATQRIKLAVSLCRNFKSLSGDELEGILKHAGAKETRAPTEEELVRQEEELKKLAEKQVLLGTHGTILRRHTKEFELKKKAESEAEKRVIERTKKVTGETEARKDAKRKRDRGDSSLRKGKKPK